MAPQVKKAKTAFLFYQSDQLAAVRKEKNLSMGDAMTELAARWRTMTDPQKAKYLQLERQDRERFERESAAADEQRLKEQEERRKALVIQDGEAASNRGARQRLHEERDEAERLKKERRLQREAEMDEVEKAERERIRDEKRKETEARRKMKAEEDQALAKQHKKLDKEEARKTANRLEYLFKQSPIFAKLKMGEGSMEDGSPEEVEKVKKKASEDLGRGGRSRSKSSASSTNKPHHIHDKDSAEEDDDDQEEEEHVFLTKQPSCIKFGQLKPYQLESLNWMIHLAEKGLNGILADEMGLGKTLQSISILAYHYEYLKIQGPHLICVPKSTLSNWMNELARWCPSLRAIRFHGSREDREAMIENYFHPAAASHDGKRPERQIMNEKGEMVDDNTDNPRQWDVCVTTYEVCNTERKVLQRFAWKYLVIDEAHRLKNDVSMFSQTVRSFRTANRLLLTGTPLQNNLRELWALLNFLLPDIFSSADQFDEWFNLEIDDEEAKKNMISQLHKILRPFMLRRLKADVAKGLPPKTETIVMVGMSKMQKQLYKKLLLRDLDAFTGNQSKNRTAVLNIVMQLRKCCGHPYLFEGVEDRTLDPLGEHLVENCGKLFMVDKLLRRLKERGSRVLIFTQMTRVLDILEDFMVMRGYEYCRIDGNTTYDDRESAIDTFNAPNSEKFCFILSTRAGGLGINLQTADTCILYDSDWNPQQDLQAQDRCHRLGQKKPVSVYRLVSENTIEEKIVERAQQKLKLDAMVVQQGRLKDKDKVSKEEMLAAVRFGADQVFRSEESTITDEDIDIILERGKAKTKELAEKIQKKEKGDLLDFRLDGGISTQTFEGVDYSDKELREQLRLLAANSIGKRERRPPPANYNPVIESKKSMIVNNTKIKLPRTLRLPNMENHQFYNRERLLELGKAEFEMYARLRETGKLPPKEFIEKTRTLLPDELGQEKIELLDEGFGDWTRTQFFSFVKAVAKYGRDDIPSIAAELDMSEDQVAPYSAAFWKYGKDELKDEWERFSSMIERGEKRIEKQKKNAVMLKKFVSTFENPREEMTFANKGTTHFALEQDRALICAVDTAGYGKWDTVRERIVKDSKLKFQHTVIGMTTGQMQKRADYRVRQMERELDAREKGLKNSRPANVVAAQKALDAIKEMEKYEVEARTRELQGLFAAPLGTLSKDARQAMENCLKDRDACVNRLREVEGQVNRCHLLAEETRQGIKRGDQYVNFSNITLKGGTTFTTAGGDLTFEVLPDLESGAIEARINKPILKIPECGQCENCISKGSARKLCVRRLEERNKLIIAETKKALKARGKSTNKIKPGLITSSGPVVASSNGFANAASSKKRKGEPMSAPPSKKSKTNSPTPSAPGEKKTVKMIQTPNGLKPRVTSQGNKRMSIPDDAFPEFCRRIGAYGTAERRKLIQDFADEHPTTSIRQVTLKLGEITQKDPPTCLDMTGRKVRAFTFYLRPKFYKHLPPDDRPADWEKAAAEDEIKWQQEKAEEKAKKLAEKAKNEAEGGASSEGAGTDAESIHSGSASNDVASPSVADGDETEDEGVAGEPVAKKLRVE
ncbi:helicase [Nitzschia inconspicua]|uniref:Helicase n=2 Tax=Nitzschia inconspicua TaxID=303405 RepID=A0A9K3LYC5_9STRA|nr:helicase [Nitzschia inconspicua]